AIKWPDLDGAAAMHPLPARPTGRAGVETSALDRSENDAFDSRSFAENSLTNLVHPAPAPYSLPAPDVPPSQQYHDDPAAFGGQYPQQPEGYYDPYRGPVPKSMTLPPEDQYGRKSPGPYNAYEGGRTGSPGPQPPYGGGIGVGRVPSPGPQAAYAGRTPSPGPQNAYGSGIPRTTSPGPYGAFDEDPYGGTDQHTMEQHHQQQTQGRNENFGSAG
ncbi:uncharacterized protein EI90DRAFT_2906223, partial [Cantharellus anzutake]|uniref:uncharacterized protein n=1 Tax=Cantharellus anzutake TaxID=1750568 RepID=UPI00190757A0